MKRLLLVFVLAFVIGCNVQPSPAPPIARLRFGMQQYDVEEICGKSLTFVSLEQIPDTNGCSKGIYRMWSYRPNDPKTIWGTYSILQSKTPFKLTFVIYPPLTTAQCTAYIVKNNISEPNEVEQIMSLVGYQVSKLIKVEEDTTQVMIETAREQTRAIQQNSDAQNQHILTPNAYGPGVHSNRYGQPVKLRPDFGGVPGEVLQITPDAYGLGVHSDQYGRPVREYLWP